MGMALLSSSRFLSLSSFSPYPKTPASCCTCVKMKAPDAVNKDAAAILWYKHDLRVDDHPGIVLASMHRTLVPLYIFDPRILSRKFLNHLPLVMSFRYLSCLRAKKGWT